MSFNDLLKKYQIDPVQPEKPGPPVRQPQPAQPDPLPAQPVKPVPMQPARQIPVQPVMPMNSVKPAPEQPVKQVPAQPVRPAPVQPVRPAQPASVPPTRPADPVRRPEPAKPSSGAQQLLDELDTDVLGGKQEPVQPLHPGNINRPHARPPRSTPGNTPKDLPPYWYLDVILLGVTVLAGLAILSSWDSVMDAVAGFIMSLADMALIIAVVLAVVLFVFLWLRRRYRWQRFLRRLRL